MSTVVECVVIEPSWYNGSPVEPGAIISLSRSDADYLCSIGRVQLVPPEPEAVAPEEPVEATEGRKGKG